jgi:suppressor of tumorigenicity protein 13
MPDAAAAAAADEEEADVEPPFPPVYSSGDDYDAAASLKQEASDAASEGRDQDALDLYNRAVQAAPPSALLYANRATVLLRLHRLRAAERDCDLALAENPDSAKALRVRGKCRKELGHWEDALKDLSASQAIDFDEGTVEDLKFLTEKHLEKEKTEAEKRLHHEEKLKMRASEIKRAQQEAAREAAEEEDDGPQFRGGGGGGMPGMEGLMGTLLSDPELLQELQKPKVQAAFQELMSGPGGPMAMMSNPAKLQELMSDPEVGPVLQKMLNKLGMSPGGGGAGTGPAAGFGGGAATASDDIPDLGTSDLD